MTAYFLLLGLLILMEQHILPEIGLTICFKPNEIRPSLARLLLGRLFALVVYTPVLFLLPLDSPQSRHSPPSASRKSRLPSYYPF